MDRFKGIEEKLDRYPSIFLFNLEKQLRFELEEVLTQEASLWKQKAQCKWMCNGGQNTNIFHASTINMKRSNLISKLRLGGDSLCDDFKTLHNKWLLIFTGVFSQRTC